MTIPAYVNQLELFRASRDGIDQAFVEFNHANPQVYDELLKLALRGKARGLRKLGMKMLFEVVRWNTALATSDPSGFRLNNNFTSRYARLLMSDYRCADHVDDRPCDKPLCLVGMFETRGLDSDPKPVVGRRNDKAPG